MQVRLSVNGLPVEAVYTKENVEGLFLPFLRELTRKQKEKGSRLTVLFAAPPGAGKSTLAAFLERLSENEMDLTPLTVIGMDGFHYEQTFLNAHTTVVDGETVPLAAIKGAPITFDLNKLAQRLRRVSEGEDCFWPVYDRTLHNPRDNALSVTGDIVLLEGNYLLLDEDGWRDLRRFADVTLSVMTEEDILLPRLVRRKMAGGLDEKEALAFVNRSDRRNVRLCLQKTLPADVMWRLLPDNSYAPFSDQV